MTEPKYSPYDAPLRWEIESSSEEGSTYLVDLGANDGLGECQCRGFTITCSSANKKGQKRFCRHINIARQRFLDWAIWAFNNHDKNQSTDIQV